jgi:hypothetical protein
MTHRRLISLLGALLLPLALSAQPTGGVTGTVIERGGRIPVEGASVVLYQGATEVASASTNEDGRFRIGELADGSYDLVVVAPDYLETRMGVAIDGGYVRNLFNISLSQARPEIFEEMIEEFDMGDSGYSDNPTVLFDQNDVFNSIAGYNFSSVRFNVRGYNSNSQDVYLAGVRMNDAVTGGTPFSLWSGLNEATRSKATVTGTEVSDYGLGRYNGLTNIFADAPNIRTGLRGSVLTNSTSYRLRLMLTYASGVTDSGWSYAFSTSARLGGNDWIRGVYYRSFAYYASIAKDWRSSRLSLTVMGTPGSRGAQNASTQEVYDLVGDNMYNSNWGYQAGRVRNSRVRNTHEPIAFLKYDFNPSDAFKLSMTLLGRFGTNGYTALDWNDALDPRPDYYRNLPSYFYQENPDYGRNSYMKWAAAREAWMYPERYSNITQLNWDRLYDVNRSNVEGTGLRRSKYIQEERFVDQRDLHFATSFKWRMEDQITFTGGFELRSNRTEYYKKVADLLGGDYYVDVDSFAERDYASVAAKTQNDLDYYLAQGSARALRVGDKFGYDYYAQVRQGRAWLNGRFSLGNFSTNIGGEVGYTTFWREGLVRKGLFPGQRADGSDFVVDGVNLSRDESGNLLPSSYGKSPVQRFLTWSGKMSLNWVIGGKMRIYLNAGAFQDAPTFDKAYLSPRTRDSVVDGLKPVQTYTTDLNWQYSGGGVNVRLTGYYTKIFGQTDVMSAFDDLQNAFSNFALSGIDEQHYGVELGFEVPTFIPNLSLQGALSAGRYEYTSNPTMVQTVDNSAAPVDYGGSTTVLIPYWKSHPVFKRDVMDGITPEIDHFQQHYVPGTPQLAASLGLSYNYNYWFIDADAEYFAGAYLDMNPLYRTDFATAGPDNKVTPAEVEYMAAQECFKPCYLVNLSIGKSWYIDRKYQIGFSLNAKNLLNNRDVKTGGYEQTRLVDNTVSKERYYRFDSKYFYMSGVNYMLNVYFRF